MLPTAVTLSKASRLPLTSKQANKNFYKGTRTGNVLLRKRIALVTRTTGAQLYDAQGHERTWNKRVGGRLDESRMVSFVVPPGLADTKLKPYVFTGKESESGVPRPERGYPGGPRMSGPRALDGTYYSSLIDAISVRRARQREAESDMRVVRERVRQKAIRGSSSSAAADSESSSSAAEESTDGDKKSVLGRFFSR
ncbi:hypothetical protein K437DRAFT_241230 [Tilletiaria anomala UBC 951]|uniref:Ribosomal protein L27 n=1 Tax=Tilletiaria anomala (strain ATCC 24038 / CBS 436.72 / UBC 951) TaxID=1037660 RepID=A0A066V3T7_TILAU|nr:uncharacterized protein K437DRAFT_241230 [Tilletiaria anomala UBC 951]KDN36357.1 hypothetical protein K437DRAFT_241230 [Tilletiaria anomala UBC 951]